MKFFKLLMSLIFIAFCCNIGNAQTDWVLKTQNDTVLVQQGKNWISVTPLSLTEMILTQTESLLVAKDELIAAQQKVIDNQNRIKDFKNLKFLIERKENELAAADAPKKKK